MFTRLFLLFSILLAGTATGQGLSYQWKPNTEYVFKAVSNDQFSMGGGMMGMGMMNMSAEAMNFKTESVFTLAIEKVNPNGSADGTFYLNRFSVTDEKGNKLATLANIPKKALTAPFTVDAKGNFTFRKLPILLCRENSTLLVEAKLKPGEMAASAEMDGEKVSLCAEFNPKTGTMKAGYSVQNLKPKPKPVEVKEDDETIDLVPTDFLDLLQLPEGPVSKGQVFKSKMYGFEMIEKVVDFNNKIANLDFKFKSGVNSKTMEKDAEAMMGDDAEDMSADTDGMETPTIAQDMTGNIQLVFDNGKGMMQSLGGTITTKSNMMGMEITTKSTLQMTPVTK